MNAAPSRRSGRGNEAGKKQGKKDKDRSNQDPRSIDKTSHKGSESHQHQYPAQGENDGQTEAASGWAVAVDYGYQHDGFHNDFTEEYQPGHYAYSGQSGWAATSSQDPQTGLEWTAHPAHGEGFDYPLAPSPVPRTSKRHPKERQHESSHTKPAVSHPKDLPDESSPYVNKAGANTYSDLAPHQSFEPQYPKHGKDDPGNLEDQFSGLRLRNEPTTGHPGVTFSDERYQYDPPIEKETAPGPGQTRPASGPKGSKKGHGPSRFRPQPENQLHMGEEEFYDVPPQQGFQGMDATGVPDLSYEGGSGDDDVPPYQGQGVSFDTPAQDVQTPSEFNVTLHLRGRQMKHWKEAQGLLDSGNRLGHMILMDKLFSMGIRSEEIDFSRMEKIQVVGGSTLKTAGVIRIIWRYVEADDAFEEDFHILEDLLGDYEVLLAMDPALLQDSNAPTPVAATIEAGGGVTEKERIEMKNRVLKREEAVKRGEARRGKRKETEKSEKKKHGGQSSSSSRSKGHK